MRRQQEGAHVRAEKNNKEEEYEQKHWPDESCDVDVGHRLRGSGPWTVRCDHLWRR
ncbi:hypothetical protein CBM2592_B150067 [Cupriavidus taiwanensis]|nr:hypothetical protein CBM2592_B150067 [Cupriavidus taiwanensis]SOY94823.1 hypothetical protein CBM2591_B140069 [Cupriavidus taiwanensis]SOZ71737.1 hypothetical protein CBM2617_B180074 [Cupriavidus taiwanensis]SOZ90041.1 hypothetical protein CBM2622_B190074 [Cupriavidus taiwanensis]SOZ94626.1 hypothetical protein CBM2621_B190071 [Cupriavidus taiwanensis]